MDLGETDTFTSCLSSNLALHSGVASFDGPLELSCLSPFFVGHDYTIDWNSGADRDLGLTFTFSVVGGQAVEVATGTVLNGQFEGHSVYGVYTYPTLDLEQCATQEGVTNAGGTITLEIGPT
ncbi:hypothetical protein ACFVOK_37445 [Streptomyces sp. NPDC057798]|uniref:hypothetical protein n=1 Tax=Streptomyces sp. NPDC057798 TaxID=3346252 RepID=UPI00367FC47D